MSIPHHLFYSRCGCLLPGTYAELAEVERTAPGSASVPANPLGNRRIITFHAGATLAILAHSIIWTATAVAARFAISIRVILVVHHKLNTC